MYLFKENKIFFFFFSKPNSLVFLKNFLRKQVISFFLKKNNIFYPIQYVSMVNFNDFLIHKNNPDFQNNLLFFFYYGHLHHVTDIKYLHDSNSLIKNLMLIYVFFYKNFYKKFLNIFLLLKIRFYLKKKCQL